MLTVHDFQYIFVLYNIEVEEEVLEYLVEYVQSSDVNVTELIEVITSLIPNLHSSQSVELRAPLQDILSSRTKDNQREDRRSQPQQKPTHRKHSSLLKTTEVISPSVNKTINSKDRQQTMTSANAEAPSLDPTMSFLHSLSPDTPLNIIEGVLEKFGGNVDSSAHYILDQSPDAIIDAITKYKKDKQDSIQRETEKKKYEEERVKKRILNSYADVPLQEDNVFHRPDAILKSQHLKEKRDKKARHVRYLEDKVVTNKGEKYVALTKKEEDPSTFVSLKIVHTKRKGGKGSR